MCLDLYKEYGTTMVGLKVQTHVPFVACWIFTTTCPIFSSPFLIMRSLFPAGIRLRIWQRWVPCNCSWYLAISQSEAWPCFEDPPTFNSTEKNSMNTNQLVLFSVFLLYSEMICLDKMVTGIIFIYQPKIWLLQVFTNSDKAHAEEALCRLGLQGCFDGVICFETLNPCNGPSALGMLFPDETSPTWLIWMNPMGSDPYHPSSASLQALRWSHVSCNSDCKRWSQENSKNTAFLKKNGK